MAEYTVLEFETNILNSSLENKAGDTANDWLATAMLANMGKFVKTVVEVILEEGQVIREPAISLLQMWANNHLPWEWHRSIEISTRGEILELLIQAVASFRLKVVRVALKPIVEAFLKEDLLGEEKAILLLIGRMSLNEDTIVMVIKCCFSRGTDMTGLGDGVTEVLSNLVEAADHSVLSRVLEKCPCYQSTTPSIICVIALLFKKIRKEIGEDVLRDAWDKIKFQFLSFWVELAQIYKQFVVVCLIKVLKSAHKLGSPILADIFYTIGRSDRLICSSFCIVLQQMLVEENDTQLKLILIDIFARLLVGTQDRTIIVDSQHFLDLLQTLRHHHEDTLIKSAADLCIRQFHSLG